jgi:prepilin-type N-terminal cleavage/methylation domain-containing protein
MKINFIKEVKKKNFPSSRGFTLIELVVSIGIFIIITGASSAAFAAIFGAYKGAKNLNANLENAQFAMNLISKTLRTSTILSPTSDDSDIDMIQVFDFSQNKCFEYSFTGGNLLMKGVAGDSAAAPDYGCNFSGSSVAMTSGVVDGSFFVVLSKGDDGEDGPISEKVGRITTAMEISNGGGNYKKVVNLQSTVSLRDYNVSNIGIDVESPLP